MRDRSPDAGELLRRIAKLSSESEWTPQETREALSDAGVSPEDLGGEVLKLVARLKRESPHHWKAKAQVKRSDLLKKLRARADADTMELTRPQLLQQLGLAINRLPEGVAAQYSVAFRKFEEATDEDLRSMLEEIAIFNDLEQESH